MKKGFCFLLVIVMCCNFTFCQIMESEKNSEVHNESEQTDSTQTDDRLALVNEAMKYKGTPYKYASATTKGMDCSGLVYRCSLDVLDISLPRSSSGIASFCTKLSEKAEPQIGDFLFFNTTGKGISHVGIYLGDGTFIHSASDGPKTGVIISTLNESYWKKCFLFYGSIFK